MPIVLAQASLEFGLVFFRGDWDPLLHSVRGPALRIIVTVLLCLGLVVSVCVNVLVTLLLVTMSLIVTNELVSWNRNLASVIQSQFLTADVFWLYRDRHRKLCQLIETVNDILSANILLTLVFNTAILCMSVYTVIWNNTLHDPWGIANLINVILTSSVSLASTLITFARLQTQVSE